MQALIAGLAALAGILLGYWLRHSSAASEGAQSASRISELTADLTALRAELAQVHTLCSARAGFESLCAEREKSAAQLTAERDALRAEIDARAIAQRDQSAQQAAQISKLEADLRNERQNLQEKLALLETAKQSLSHQFESLAADILEKKSKTFAEASQKDLDTVLGPFRTQLKEFRERVDKVQTESNTGVTELKTLIGTLGNLNQALTKEAHNLATALRRDTKAQGNWGETILRNILDKSGLQEGLHYTFQQSFIENSTESQTGQRRYTDIVVKLPGGRHLVIDSKVSLNAYNDSVNAPDEKDRADAAKRHLTCVREHYRELSSRNYQTLPGIQSPDFVVMFVPIEPAFLLAIQEDEDLWLDAYQKGVLLAGPTTVLFVVRIVENFWDQERRSRNVDEVMERGARLYEKFAAFINDMEDLGRSLHAASNTYDGAKKKLSEGRDNLVLQVEKLRKLGVKPKFSKKAKPVPLSWLASADVEDEGLVLAAEAEASSDEASTLENEP